MTRDQACVELAREELAECESLDADPKDTGLHIERHEHEALLRAIGYLYGVGTEAKLQPDLERDIAERMREMAA